MSTFVLNRNYELALPSIYVDVDNEEMEYVDGGALSTATKAAIIAGVVIAGVGFACALAYGQVWLGLKLAKGVFGTALKGVMKAHAGAVIALIASCVVSSFGISAAATTATISWIIKNF